MVRETAQTAGRGSRAKDPREGAEIRCILHRDGGPVGVRIVYDPYRYGSPGEQALHEIRNRTGHEPRIIEAGEREKIVADRKRVVHGKRSQIGVRLNVWR